jgi:hypothetical protein
MDDLQGLARYTGGLRGVCYTTQYFCGVRFRVARGSGIRPA